MAQGMQQRVLRVGIIQNGKIVEERLLRKRESVTIGQASRNTFILPSAVIPKSYTLFELKGGTFHLNFQSRMTGKVSVDDSVLDLSTIRDRKLAAKNGSHHTLPLSEKSRGKIVIDDVTLLFQFVTPPPPPSKLQLPASVRGGLIKSIDWPFTNIILGSMIFQIFAVAFIVTRDYPEPPQGISQLPDRWVEMLKETPETPKPKAVEKDNSKEKDDGEKVKEKVEKKVKKKPKKAEKTPPKVETPAKRAQQEKDRVRRMHEKVQGKTIIQVLGAAGDGKGSLLDTLKGGAADVAMKTAFEGTSGVMIADDSTKVRDRRGMSGSGRVAGISSKELRTKGGGPVSSGKKGSEVKVRGKIKVKRPSEAFGTGSLDSSAIYKVVRRRIGAIKSCYEKQLKNNPKLHGKVKVRLTILQSGRVGSAKLVQNTVGDPKVGKCIVNAIRRFRFPKPDGGEVTTSLPFVFQPAG